MSIPFAGPITPDAERDIRTLYLMHIPGTREVLVLCGVFALASFGFPNKVATYVYRLPPAHIVPLSLGERLPFLPLAAIFFLIAFRLHHWWWRWWWPKLEQSCGERLSGAVSSEGVRWGSQVQIIPWRGFISAKLSDEVVLLYLTKAYPLPFHRSMFEDPADWEACRRLVAESKVRLYRFR